MAVVVLYNNSLECKACLQSIKNQTYKVDKIIIIDNSDEEYKVSNLEIICDIFNNKNVMLFSSKKNLGSALGFAIGMHVAVACKADYVWLNDQDGIADRDCLLEMIKNVSPINHDIFIPNVMDVRNKKELMNFHVKINWLLNGYYSNFMPTQIATTGTLISKEIIDAIGVYDFIHCYVGNEDKEYSLRARKYGFNISYVKSSKYYHPDLGVKYGIKSKTECYYKLYKKLLPWNLGILTVNNHSLRMRKIVYSSAYINSIYNSCIGAKINFIYTLIRATVTKGSLFIDTYRELLAGHNAANVSNFMIRINDITEYVVRIF